MITYKQRKVKIHFIIRYTVIIYHIIYAQGKKLKQTRRICITPMHINYKENPSEKESKIYDAYHKRVIMFMALHFFFFLNITYRQKKKVIPNFVAVITEKN